MKSMRNFFPIGMAGFVFCLFISLNSIQAQGQPVNSFDQALGISGGLLTQIGSEDLNSTVELSQGGRFLIHLLEVDDEKVKEKRQYLSEKGLNGVISVDSLYKKSSLPYTENLVNAIWIKNELPQSIPLKELMRVLTPNGVLLIQKIGMEVAQLQEQGFENIEEVKFQNRSWLRAKKPWPKEMDEWSHPRHSPSANAVSKDQLVGPPRRVRWLAGPWEELSSMVTASGRLYYIGLLTRDAFNGLRLWERPLDLSPAAGGYHFRRAKGSVPPVAGGKYLFIFDKDKVLALDGASGKVLHEYPTKGQPTQFLYKDGRLLVISKNLIESFDVKSESLNWAQKTNDPRAVVIGEKLVAYIQGEARKGEKVEAVVLEEETGSLLWRKDSYPWLASVKHVVYHEGKLAYEVSSFNDNSPGNSLHVLASSNGSSLFDHHFPPAMSHWRQARAIFIKDQAWVLTGGRVPNQPKVKGEKPKRKTKYLKPKLASINLETGQVERNLSAGLAHCFPPVATQKYFLSGEMDLTDLKTGKVDANRITKAACGRDTGWVPANGLLYVAPKHCVCWPMLRGYAALAPARPNGNPANRDLKDIEFSLTRNEGINLGEDSLSISSEDDWPSYRHDGWRSSSTLAKGPNSLKVIWSSELGSVAVKGPLSEDWSENPFSNGPITAPVIANGKVVVARPDAQEVVALNSRSGKEEWRFPVSGRVDTAPTLHKGMCLFGSRNGYVYCLRLSDGNLMWKFKAAPLEERIVTYGQLESPWPVPGSVLLVNDVAYFAAGRQSFADGGILVFAVEPKSGKKLWVKRLNTVPQKGFYNSSGLEFDNFDLLHRQGEGVAMSRWEFSRKDGSMTVKPWQAYAKLNTGKASAWVPQGSWSYAPRHMRRTKEHTRKRPLVAFRDNTLIGCLQGMETLFRRDFKIDKDEKFDTKWLTGWKLGSESRAGRSPWQANRLARRAKWVVPVFNNSKAETKGRIEGLVLAGDRIFTANTNGSLQVRSTVDGKLLDQIPIPVPLWDGLAVTEKRIYLSTKDGSVLCIGE